MSRLWIALANNDILSRYRGSVLGPFWITITTIVFILGIGALYSSIMKVPMNNYVPYLATGIIIWNFINQLIVDGADSFIAASQILRQTAIPLPLFIWRTAWRNVLIFCHQAPVLLGVGLWFHYLLKMNVPEAALGLFLVVVNVSWIAFCAAIACARFRDLQQVLASIMQLLFFVSPIIWVQGSTNRFGKITELNPIANMLSVTRNPLIGQSIDMNSVVYLLVMGSIGWLLTFLIFAAVRRRIVHYV